MILIMTEFLYMSVMTFNKNKILYSSFSIIEEGSLDTCKGSA